MIYAVTKGILVC